MKRLFLFLLLLVVMAPAAAAGPIITLSFDTLAPGEDVLAYYADGFGSQGSGPGPDYGVTFGPGAIVGGPDVYGYPLGYSALFNPGTIMNLNTEFSGPFSFYYRGGPGSVGFFSDAGGTGTQVYSLLLVPSLQFYPQGADVPLFRSAVFQVPSNNLIDAVTFGAQVIPEPTPFLLIGTGLGGLVLAAYRRKKA